MEKLCDLHTHSVFSDGTNTPAEIIDLAIQANLSAVALSDHNTVDGLSDFLSAAEGKNIEAIAGSEISVDYNGTELHMLALFIPKPYFSHITELMKEMHVRKEESNIALTEALASVGMILDYQAIKSSTVNGQVNRAHFAKALMQKGYVSSIDEAFKTHLSLNAGLYNPPKRLTVWEALDFIKTIGAVSVLAHPFLNLSLERLTELLPVAKAHGLVGMECFYPLYDDKLTEESFALAENFGIKPSGGSDFHGSTKPYISIGVGKGDLRIPYEWAVELKNSLNK